MFSPNSPKPSAIFSEIKKYKWLQKQNKTIYQRLEGTEHKPGIYILAISTPLGGRNFLSKLKNREEFDGLEKRKGKGGKEEKKRKEW